MKTMRFIVLLMTSLSWNFALVAEVADEPEDRLFPNLFSRYVVGDANAENPLENTEGPKSLITADLNGDGLADAITGNLDGSLSVLLGQTNRSFRPQWLQPATNLLRHASLRALVAADFNRDGKPDIAAADIAEGRVIVLLGQGDGTLRQYQAMTVGPGRALATADFNGDGNADLLLACGPPDCETLCFMCLSLTNRSLAVLLGQGDGTFRPPQWLLTPASIGCFYDVAAEDVNGDGLPDAVLLDFYWHHVAPLLRQKRLLVFFNQGGGTFVTNAPSVTLTPSGEGPRSFTLAYLYEQFVPPADHLRRAGRRRGGHLCGGHG